MNKKILILGAGKYYRNCILSAKNTGYHIVCVDKDPQALAQHAADEFHVIDFSQKDTILAFAQERQVDAIIPLNDYGVKTAAYVSSQLGLPGIGEEAAEIATNKYLMREAWQRHGLPNPRYQMVDSQEESLAFAESIGYPVIFKPANSLGGGSRGVQTAHSPKEVKSAYEFARSAYTDQQVLIEECVNGIEHSAEVLTMNGETFLITVSDKVKTPYPYRVDEKVVYPTQVSGKDLTLLHETIVNAVKALGITVGAAHVEACTTPNGPVLFELGARCGGGSTADPITTYVTGYPYFENLVHLLSGENVTQPPAFLPASQNNCIYGFFTTENQEHTHLLKNNQFVDWELFTTQETTQVTRQGSDRLGYYIFKGSPKELTYLHESLKGNM